LTTKEVLLYTFCSPPETSFKALRMVFLTLTVSETHAFIRYLRIWQHCDLLFGHWGQKLKTIVSCIELTIPNLVGVAFGIVLLSLTVFEIFSIFVCMENPIPTPNFGGFGGEDPKKVGVQNSDLQKQKCTRIRVFWAFLHLLGRRVWSWRAWENKKKNKNKLHHPYISPPCRSSATDPKWTKLGRVGALPNIITLDHFHVHCSKAVGVARVVCRSYSSGPPVGFNTAAQLCCPSFIN